MQQSCDRMNVIKGEFNKLPTAEESILFQSMGIFLSVKASKWLILFAHFCRVTTKNTPILWNFLKFHLNTATGKSKRQKDEIKKITRVYLLIFWNGPAGLCEFIRVIRSLKWRKIKRYTRRSVDTISLLPPAIKLSLYKTYLTTNFKHNQYCLKICSALLSGVLLKVHHKNHRAMIVLKSHPFLSPLL